MLKPDLGSPFRWVWLLPASLLMTGLLARSGSAVALAAGLAAALSLAGSV
jgi:hypothetical protein